MRNKHNYTFQLRPYAVEIGLDGTSDLQMAIIENASYGVVVLDKDGTVLCSNKKGKELLQTVTSETGDVREGSASLMAYDGTEMTWNEVLLKLSSTNDPASSNFLFGIKAKGCTKWFNAHQSKVDGIEERKVISFHDVTAMVEIAEKEREAKRFYETIVNNLVDVVNITDLDLNFRYINPSVEKLRGFTADECSKHRLEDIMTPESQAIALSVLREEIAREANGGADPDRVRYLELEEYRKDGSTVTVGNWVKFLRNGEGRPIGLIIQSRDVSEIKDTYDMMRDSLRKLSLLSQLTRHDIRNQLQTAIGWMDLLEAQGEKDRERIARALQAIKNAMQLIDFSAKYESLGSKTPIFVSPREVVNSMASTIEMPNMRLENLLGQELVLMDPLFPKVVYNLLENVQRHGGRATCVRFRSEVRDGNLLIICEDDGVGVRKECKEDIFRQGFGSNTGDGLFYVRQVLSITGATIREEGVPGEGAKFIIEVPKGHWK